MCLGKKTNFTEADLKNIKPEDVGDPRYRVLYNLLNEMIMNQRMILKELRK